MRTTAVLCALGCCLAVVAASVAQLPVPPIPAPGATNPTPAGGAPMKAPAASVPVTIVQPDAEVRARPGAEIYATNRLRQGQRVEVLREREDGWLEIRPPEGSFSWINATAVERIAPNQPNWAVKALSPVLIGSEVLKGRPNVEGGKLQPGAQVRAIGSPLTDADGSWLPIEPPPGEVRYVRIEAIGRSAPKPGPIDTTAGDRFNNPTAAPRPDAGMVQGSPASFPKSPPTGLPPLVDVNTLWQRAQQAEKQGEISEAIRLYNQIGAESATSNRELATAAYNRAFQLREFVRNPGGSTFTPTPMATPMPASNAGTPNFTAPAGSVSAAPTSFARPTGAATDPTGLPTSGPGRLRRAGRAIDNRLLYVLDDSRGLPRVYATPQPGVELESFVGRNVELFGAMTYSGALRANLMVVTRVQPLQ